MDRLYERMRTEDKAVILAPEALDEVEEVIAAVIDPPDVDPRTRTAALLNAAELCARRFVLAGDGNPVELALMVALTKLSSASAPGRLTPWITELVDGMAADEEFAVFADPFIWMELAENQPPGDSAALILLRLASLARSPDDPDQADIAEALSVQLKGRPTS